MTGSREESGRAEELGREGVRVGSNFRRCGRARSGGLYARMDGNAHATSVIFRAACFARMDGNAHATSVIFRATWARRWRGSDGARSHDRREAIASRGWGEQA